MGIFLQIIFNVVSHFKENHDIWHCQRGLAGLFEVFYMGISGFRCPSENLNLSRKGHP